MHTDSTDREEGYLAGQDVRVGGVSLGLVDQLLGVRESPQGAVQLALDVTGGWHLHCQSKLHVHCHYMPEGQHVKHDAKST